MPAAPLHLIRPEVRAERAYRVPTDAHAPAKLDQNESPSDLPAPIKRALAEQFAASDWNRYPDDRPHQLIAALAERLDVPADGIIVGRGSNEIVHTLGLCFFGRDVPVVLPRPMFALYASVARMHATRLTEVDADADFSHDPTRVLAAAQDAGAAVTIVTTPNNPTGSVFSFDALDQLAAGVPGLLLIDEAYHEFVEGPTALDLVRQHANVLVMRTFSKALGLAGLRLGLLFGASEVIQEIEKARLPFLVDRFSESIGLAVLDHPELVSERIAMLQAERAAVQAFVSGMDGVEIVPGAANFFLMRTPLSPADCCARMAAHGVRIRDVSGYPALSGDEDGEGWVRVSVGAPAENRAFEAALARVLATSGVPAGG